ncbi:HAD-IB family hydrolase [Nocardia pseudobrasiliensis]|uniref:1-acyl-sn-glycerol-3-phosphate acyltransferase n=1 Tax=Nocardia pseudobrasiliensis TaxID=45979 RepID=A0A370HSG8_9NOCA|nr:HAD-IB family hydrolase [Nocardia pseudobrasiliensis]RDI61466.1 1-acyl-sn-glycerol-3-phosphate acyltransferase [Nocardia pseudobrasiliensis]
MSTAGELSVDAAVRAIRSGPRGPRVGAIFDFGGTVVHGFTLPSGPGRLLRRRGARGALAEGLLTSIRGARGEGEYERFLQRTMHTWAGHSESELTELGENLFRRTIYGHLYPEAWRLIRAHEAAGHTIVLATCLTRFQVLPAAAELGIEHVLYTAMATEDGILTGHVDGKPLWRNGKADAVRRFALARDIDLTESYAYADSAPDLPLLELAGHPTAVNPAPRTAMEATERGWPVLSFRPRRAAGIGDIARTAAGFTGLLGGAVVGALAKSGTRDQRRMADSMIGVAAEATLRTTGVRIRITGARHARQPRPAVFVFNHQSQFDMVVLAEVLGSGFTGIVKQEVTSNPIFGPLLRFAGATFIDRSDTAGAKAALAPVVDTLRGGLSLVIAPEGTRSLTPRVGRFKKGAFHIAIQAGVPVIPIVIRNAGEIAWRNSAVVRKGVVDVAVLAPIDVSGWDPQEMDDEVERVRQLFVETLLDWPAPDADAALSTR